MSEQKPLSSLDPNFSNELSLKESLRQGSLEEKSRQKKISLDYLSQIKKDPTYDLGDTAMSLGVGFSRLIEAAGTIQGAVTGNMDNTLRNTGKDNANFYNERKNLFTKRSQKNANDSIAEADGILGKAKTAIWETVDDPQLFYNFMLEQLPNLAAGGAIGKGAGIAAKSLGASASKATTIAGKGGVVGSSTLHGADAAGGVYDSLMQLDQSVWDENPEWRKLRKIVGDDEAKKQIAITRTRAALAISTGASLLTQKLPGGDVLEKTLAGAGTTTGRGVIASTVAGAAGEGLQEVLEEGSGNITANAVVKTVDESRELDEGLGEAIGLGLLGGATTGGGLGTVKGIASGLSDSANKVGEGSLPNSNPDLDQSEIRKKVQTANDSRDVSPLLDESDKSSFSPLFAAISASKIAETYVQQVSEGKKLSESEEDIRARSDLIIASQESRISKLTKLAKSAPEADKEKANRNVEIAQAEMRQIRNTIGRINNSLTALTAPTTDEKSNLIDKISKAETAEEVVEEKERVLNLAMRSPEAYSDEELYRIGESASLENDERAYVESLIDTRKELEAVKTVLQEGKSLQEVNSDVINGGEGFKGAAQYTQDAADQLNRGNLAGAEAEAANLKRFYENRTNKLKVAKEAQTAQQASQAEKSGIRLGFIAPIKDDENGAWEVSKNIPGINEKHNGFVLMASEQGQKATQKLIKVLAAESQAIAAAQKQVDAAIKLASKNSIESTVPASTESTTSTPSAEPAVEAAPQVQAETESAPVVNNQSRLEAAKAALKVAEKTGDPELAQESNEIIAEYADDTSTSTGTEKENYYDQVDASLYDNHVDYGKAVIAYAQSKGDDGKYLDVYAKAVYSALNPNSTTKSKDTQDKTKEEADTKAAQRTDTTTETETAVEAPASTDPVASTEEVTETETTTEENVNAEETENDISAAETDTLVSADEQTQSETTEESQNEKEPKKRKGNIPQEDFRKKNLVVEYFVRKKGKETSKSLNPLVVVKDFYNSLFDENMDLDASQLEQFLAGEEPSPEQSKQFRQFLRFHKKMAPLFQQSLIEGAKNKTDEYHHEDSILFLVSPEGTVDENDVTAMVIAAYTYLGETADSINTMSPNQVRRTLGLAKTDYLSPFVYNALFEKGARSAFVSSDMGQRFTQAAGLRAVKDAPANTQNNMELSAGNHIIAVLTGEGLLNETVHYDAELANGDMNRLEEGREGPQLKRKTGQLFITAPLEENGDLQENVREIVDDRKGTGSFLSNLFSIENGEQAPATEANSFRQKLVKNAPTRIPKILIDALKTYAGRKWNSSSDMEQVTNGISEAILEKMAGVIDFVTENNPDVVGQPRILRRNKLVQEAKNNDIRRGIASFYNWKQSAKSFTFYLTPSVWKQQRVGNKSNMINPQTDKFQRSMVSMSEWMTEIDLSDPSSDSHKYFLLAVAQGFGIDTDKQFHYNSLSQLADFTKETDKKGNPTSFGLAMDAINASFALETNEDGSPGQLDALQQEALLTAVQKGGMNIHSLKSLVSYAQYQNAIKYDQPFESDIMYEVDGVNNGPALAQIALGSADAQLAQAFGMYGDTGPQNFAEFSDGTNNLDLYEQVGADLLTAMGSIEKDYNKRNAQTIMKLVGAMGDEDKSKSTRRKFVKQPLTALIFGSAPSSAVESMADDFIERFFEGYENKLQQGNYASAKQDLIDFNTLLKKDLKIPIPATVNGAWNVDLSDEQLKSAMTTFTFSVGKAMESVLKAKFNTF